MNNLHSVILTNIKILKFNELILNILYYHKIYYYLSYKNNGYDIEEKIIVYLRQCLRRKILCTKVGTIIIML